LFAIDNIGFENLPPLQNAFGTITTKGSVCFRLKLEISIRTRHYWLLQKIKPSEMRIF
jgi:hypothetical protein